MNRVAVFGACLLLSTSSFAQVPNAGVPSGSGGLSEYGVGSVPMRYDRHRLFIKFWGFDLSENGTVNQMQARKERSSRQKAIVAALARFGLKPVPYVAPRTGLPDEETRLEFAFAVPDGACDGDKVGAATRAELSEAVGKISPFSSVRLNSSVSPALTKELRRECLVSAIQDAKAKVSELEHKLGVELGRLIRAETGLDGIFGSTRNLSLSKESVSPMGDYRDATVTLHVTYSIK